MGAADRRTRELFMSSISTTADSAHGHDDHGHGAHGHGDAHGHGHTQSFISKYVFSTDHKIIGIQFLMTTLLMLIVGGALALGVRWQ
jgi:cytochrome c oxidase subunit I